MKLGFGLEIVNQRNAYFVVGFYDSFCRYSSYKKLGGNSGEGIENQHFTN
jgi:hypothetical protein